MERPMDIDEASLEALQRRAPGLTTPQLRVLVEHAVRHRPASGAPAFTDASLGVRTEGRDSTVTIRSVAGRRCASGDATFTLTVEPGGRVTELAWRSTAPSYVRSREVRRR